MAARNTKPKNAHSYSVKSAQPDVKDLKFNYINQRLHELAPGHSGACKEVCSQYTAAILISAEKLSAGVGSPAGS